VLQVYESKIAEPEPVSTAAEPETELGLESATLFAAQNDETLLIAGVPSALLPAVRALRSDDDLDHLAPHLPPDAAEMLYLLAAGYSLMDAIEEAGQSRPPAPVEPDDFQTSLANPASQGMYRVITDDEELQAVLDAPLAQWRIFLHPSQRRLVEMPARGPVRVLGGAGTGKTVALMHRAAWLLRTAFVDQDDRILVTTFTRNLARDLEHMLAQLCGDSLARLEVTNLHDWAVKFMRRRGVVFHIATAEARARLLRQAWDEVGESEWALGFYRDEWDHVVQEQDVAALDDYLAARRVGRGVRLDRRDRLRVWPVLAAYRRLLDEDGIVEFADVIRETLLFVRRQGIVSPYRAVLADEVQDFSPNELKLLRWLAPEAENSLFLAGDGHQRIYGRKTTLSACGIDIRGRSRRLKLNYRTTEQIRRRAVAVLEGRVIDDLDGEQDSMRGFVSLRRGVEPKYHFRARAGDEAEAILRVLKEWRRIMPAESICVGARTHALLDGRYRPMLVDAEFEVLEVDRETDGADERPGIRLATFHRLKGLEFRCVLLAGVQEGTMPLIPHEAAGEDAAAREDRELQERCLLYVGLSRARDEVVVTGYGRPSPFLSGVARAPNE
jgi:superfamily I DNA/RNA helicase